MRRREVALTAAGMVLLLGAVNLPQPVQAEDFLSALFGAFGARPRASPQTPMPLTYPAVPPGEEPRSGEGFGGGQAWCVRSCDGRYFPIQGPDRDSRASSCDNFCPAASTELVYGGEIDDAVTEDGRPYFELPNAFRYRRELVSGCTCNGKDPVGLTQVGINNDPTLRKGDVVAGASGLMITNRAADKHAAADFSPIPESRRGRYRRVPLVAAE